MTAFRAAAWLLILPLLTACGGKSSSTPGEENQGGSSAGQSNGGSSSGGTSALGGSNTNGGNSGAAACARYDDESPASVDVSLVNKTSKAIYLGQQTGTCSAEPLFQVADLNGKVLAGVGDCRASCALVRKEGVAGCADICRFPNSIKLEPGEIHDTTWDALYRVEGMLPQSCLSFESGSDVVTCDQAKRIDAGTYQFSAIAGVAADCSMTTADGMCSSCTADPNGGCSLSAALISGQILKAEASATLDASYGFTEAKPQPNPGAGDASPGALPTASVELVFTE